MVNFSAIASLTYWTQVAFLSGYAQPSTCDLKNIIPRRDVFYAGGQYTTLTARLPRSLNGNAKLTNHDRTMTQTRLARP